MSGDKSRKRVVPRLGHKKKKQEQTKDNSFDTSRNGGDWVNTTSQAMLAIRPECRV